MTTHCCHCNHIVRYRFTVDNERFFFEKAITDASFSGLNFGSSLEERENTHVQTHYVGKAGVSTNFDENPHTQTYHASYAGVYTTLNQTSPCTNISRQSGCRKANKFNLHW